MPVADCIRRYIAGAGPSGSAEIAASLGCTDRHVRRVIADMPDISPVRQGRRIAYTTTPVALKKTGGLSEEPPLSRSEEGPEYFHPENTGHYSGHDPGHTGHGHGPVFTSGPLLPSSVNQPGKGYGKPAPGETVTPSPPARSSLCPSNAACSSCPLSLGDVEHDQIQFVIVDQLFHDLMLQTAAGRSWSMRKVRGTVWITPGPSLTVQAGEAGDAVTFYSSDPDGADIPGWIQKNFADHPNVSALAEAARRPAQLSRDELTVIVTDEETKAAVRAVLKGQFAGDGTYRRPAPNAATPGLKVYERDGMMRIETDARNQYQASTALAVRQELLAFLSGLAARPGLFADWLTRWWGPDTRPVLIDTNDLAAKIAADLRERPRPADEEAPGESPAPERAARVTEEKTALSSLLDEVVALDMWDIDTVVSSLCGHLQLERLAALSFLAAFGCWSARRFKAPVYYEDLQQFLRDEDPPPGLAEVRAACDQLRERGILEYDRRLDIKFSRVGTRLGKKLVVKWGDEGR